MATEQEILKRARELWDEQEQRFPPRVRLTWENGSELARRTAIAAAVVELEGEQAAIGKGLLV